MNRPALPCGPLAQGLPVTVYQRTWVGSDGLQRTEFVPVCAYVFEPREEPKPDGQRPAIDAGT